MANQGAAQTATRGAAQAKRSTDRLLDATEALLGKGGLEAATVPAIAERAGMSVGNVYKRFADKDALLRAVFLRFCRRAEADNARVLAPERWKDVSLHDALTALIAGTVRHYVQHRRRLAALLAYAEQHPDPRFRRRVEQMRGAALQYCRQLLETHREQLGYPDAAHGMDFVWTALISVLRIVVLAPRTPHFYAVPTDVLIEDLTNLVLRYLGVAQSMPATGKPA